MPKLKSLGRAGTSIESSNGPTRSCIFQTLSKFLPSRNIEYTNISISANSYSETIFQWLPIQRLVTGYPMMELSAQSDILARLAVQQEVGLASNGMIQLEENMMVPIKECDTLPVSL